MKVSYDDTKNQRNIDERGLDFNDVALCDWDCAMVRVDDRKEYGEIRKSALVLLADRLHSVVYTERKDVMHVISFRKANDREKRIYEAHSKP